MPLGELRRREVSLVSFLVFISLILSWQYLAQLTRLLVKVKAHHADTGGAARAAVRGVKAVLAEMADWLEWLDDLATSLETEANPHSSEEEEEPRMVIGLQDTSGKMANGTEEQEHFASSTKPRRKRPSEASSLTV